MTHKGPRQKSWGRLCPGVTLRQTRSAALLTCWLFASSAALLACTPKPQKTCAEQGAGGATLGAPWTELGVGEGEICASSAERVEFIARNRSDTAAYAREIQKKLEGNGWKSPEGAITPVALGAGKDARTSISWEQKRADRRLVVFVEGYPAGTWKDDPVKVSIAFGGPLW